MSHAFARHGVRYLSASAINTWIAQPALQLLRFSGVRDAAGPAAWRGTATDRAAAKAAFDPAVADAELLALAQGVFDQEAERGRGELPDSKIDRERRALESYVPHAAAFYRGLPERPESEQGRIEISLEGVPVPFVGYYDLLYQGQVRDTKTTSWMPGGVTQAASRQASIYARATGREPWIDYITPKEARTFRVQDPDYWLRQVALAARGLQEVLSYSDDIHACCRLFYPDLDHWMWGEASREAARAVWGMDGG